jgi:hypothetical protein
MKNTPGRRHIFYPAEAGCGQPFIAGLMTEKSGLKIALFFERDNKNFMRNLLIAIVL